MTPDQAIQILSDALQPAMSGRITRQGYITIEQALATLAEAIKPKPQNDPES